VTGAQFAADVTGLADGGWVITWRTDNGDEIDKQYGVSQQRYDSDGDKVGGEVTVAALASRELADPTIIGLSDGGWLTCWSSDGVDGDGAAIVLTRYGSNGAAIGSPTIVNDVVAGDQGLSDRYGTQVGRMGRHLHIQQPGRRRLGHRTARLRQRRTGPRRFRDRERHHGGHAALSALGGARGRGLGSSSGRTASAATAISSSGATTAAVPPRAATSVSIPSPTAARRRRRWRG
jgi:hypothetical protein